MISLPSTPSHSAKPLLEVSTVEVCSCRALINRKRIVAAKKVAGEGGCLSGSASRRRACRDLQAEFKHQFVQRSPVPSFCVCLPQAEANSVADVDQKSFERYEAVTIAQEDAAAEARLVGPGEQPGVVLAVLRMAPERFLATVEGGC